MAFSDKVPAKSVYKIYGDVINTDQNQYININTYPAFTEIRDLFFNQNIFFVLFVGNYLYTKYDLFKNIFIVVWKVEKFKVVKFYETTNN